MFKISKAVTEGCKCILFIFNSEARVDLLLRKSRIVRSELIGKAATRGNIFLSPIKLK